MATGGFCTRIRKEHRNSLLTVNKFKLLKKWLMATGGLTSFNTYQPKVFEVNLA